MGWLHPVGSLKLQVSFAEYRLFYRALLQTRPVILRSVLIVATPYQWCEREDRATATHSSTTTHTCTHPIFARTNNHIARQPAVVGGVAVSLSSLVYDPSVCDTIRWHVIWLIYGEQCCSVLQCLAMCCRVLLRPPKHPAQNHLTHSCGTVPLPPISPSYVRACVCGWVYMYILFLLSLRRGQVSISLCRGQVSLSLCRVFVVLKFRSVFVVLWAKIKCIYIQRLSGLCRGHPREPCPLLTPSLNLHFPPVFTYMVAKIHRMPQVVGLFLEKSH